MKRNRFVWMRVSQDKYELPTAVADSSVELAKMCHTNENCVRSSASRGKHKKYIRVDVEKGCDK